MVALINTTDVSCMAMGSPKPHKFLTAASMTTVAKVDYYILKTTVPY